MDHENDNGGDGNMKTVILAGGKGTRLGKISDEIPKPMVPIGERSILEHQILLLKRYGFTDITIITGHLSHVIEDHFGDGSQFGVSIAYYRETIPLGTTGGIKELEHEFQDDFLLLYGDVMVEMDLERLVMFHRERNGFATLVLHPNDHPGDSDLVELDQENRVIRFHAKPHEPGLYFHNMVNAALYVLSPRILELIPKGEKADFGKDIFPNAVSVGEIFGYPTPEYLKDVGTPERLEEVNRDHASGKIERMNRNRKRRAIFLDRDGVLLEKVAYLHKSEDVRLYPSSGKALALINETEFLAILVTNQPVIARGMCTLEELDDIHKKMEWLLGRAGAKLDGIYFCPHHPDSGYSGEIPEYKIACACRKPGIGMIMEASMEFNIDLGGSYIIGDSFRDIECGRNAGLGTIGVRTGDGCKGHLSEPDHMATDVLEAVSWIIEHEK
jgi:mannose-1-phosphate guanylyltransferase / phosphomannomutase